MDDSLKGTQLRTTNVGGGQSARTPEVNFGIQQNGRE
jgi:hypothetical protein